MAVGLTKNFLNLEFYNTKRFGIKCRVKLSKSTGRLQTMRNNFFTAVGPSLFNCVPKCVKEKQKLDNFKSALDHFLQKIPDTPPVPGYSVQNSNSIKDWVNNSLSNQQTSMVHEGGAAGSVTP